MKSDIQGCSTCPPGEEQHETFTTHVLNVKRVQYDYRTPGGILFSTIALTLEKAREQRDRWLKERDEL